MKDASLVEKTGGMMVRMMDCLSVDAMAPSLAEKMADRLDEEETAEMTVMMLDCSSEVTYICKQEPVYHVLPLC